MRELLAIELGQFADILAIATYLAGLSITENVNLEPSTTISFIRNPKLCAPYEDEPTIGRPPQPRLCRRQFVWRPEQGLLLAIAVEKKLEVGVDELAPFDKSCRLRTVW